MFYACWAVIHVRLCECNHHNTVCVAKASSQPLKVPSERVFQRTHGLILHNSPAMLTTSTLVPGRHVLATPRTQPAAHGLHVSNGTQQVLRMSRKKTYNVEVRIAAAMCVCTASATALWRASMAMTLV